MTRRRMLWVTAEPPDHERGGGSIRQAHLLDGLARAAVAVDLVLAGSLADSEVRAALSSVVELSVPHRPARRSLAARRAHDLWRVGVARLPAEVVDKRAERDVLGLELRRSSPRPDYDLVHVEHLGLAGIVPAGMAPLRSLGVQNVPSRMAEQAARLAPGGRQRLLLAAEAAAARRFQRRAAASAEVVAVVSDQDARQLLGDVSPGGPGPEVVITPNGVDPARYPVSPPPAEPRLVFTGTLDYLPNVDGIVWFARDVLPLVRRQVPAAELTIVGRRPVPEVAALAGLDGVTLHADVPSVAPFLEKARVAVVPVRIGTGSRVKALEAMASGRPVAATTIGLEGLDVDPGRDVLVGDTPADLSDAVVRLLGDAALASRVAAASRSLVEREYQWSDIADRFATDLLRLIDAVKR